MTKRFIILTHFMTTLLIGCSSVKSILPSVYKIDIDQGNIITQEMIDQLEPGMTERQVRFAMGTPLLIDVFHQNRWDYIYTEIPGVGGPKTRKRISLFFEEKKLIGVQGDLRPDNIRSFEPVEDANVVVPKIVREKTLTQKIKEFIGIEDEQ